MGGVAVQKATLTPRGLAYDRRFMLTNSNGRFLTQRQNRRMALLKTHIIDDQLIVWDRNQPLSKIQIPLEPQHFSKQQEVIIWRDSCLGNVLDERINQWFSERLNQACQLVYMPAESERLIDEKYRNGKEIVSFADGYPILLFGQAGMDDLNNRLPNPVPINRFRANIIYTGGQPFEEDNWQAFRIGKQPFRGVKPCVRCNVPNINQETGERDREPNRTLATFRRRDQKILVGMNVCWEGKRKASVKVGDELVIGQIA